MKPLNLITLILIIVGGVNWGLVGFFNLDLVAAIFGEGSLLARTVYSLIGLSALWQLVPLAVALKMDEVSTLQGRSAHGAIPPLPPLGSGGPAPVIEQA